MRQFIRTFLLVFCGVSFLLAPAVSAKTISFSYDLRGRLSTVSQDAAGGTTFGYDPAGNILSVDEVAPDSDSDGLPDSQETTLGTNPNGSDSDNDGLSDGYEVSVGLNPLVDDAHVDSDNDGLTNIQEQQLGTNPHLADSDADGIDDSTEYTDGLSGTNPLLKDTDGDGMPDGWELMYGLDLMSDDAALDKDGDGATNLAEFNGQSSPDDPTSLPQPVNIVPVLQLLLLN